MSVLKVTLMDGFVNDTVRILVDGLEVFKGEDVSYKPLLSYAEFFEVEVADGSLNIEIVVPTRKLSKTISLQMPALAHILLSIPDGDIIYHILDENQDKKLFFG